MEIRAKIEWLNPHAHFWVVAKNDDGSVSTWELELPSPNALWKEIERANINFVKEGDRLQLIFGVQGTGPGWPMP